MLNIVTVLKTGGEYDEEYLYRLYESIHKNITIPYNFWCLTDLRDIEGFSIIPIENDLTRWWSKIELFKHFIKGPTLYMDLDTIIIDNIDHLVIPTKYSFVALRGFYRDIFNSGFMYWNGNFSFITDDFLRIIKEDFIGKNKVDLHPLGNDQNFICDRLIYNGIIHGVWQDLFPGSIISYKIHIKDNRKNIDFIKNASVVCFHGKPRPRDINWNIGSMNR